MPGNSPPRSGAVRARQAYAGTGDIASASSSTERSRASMPGAWWVTISSSAPVRARNSSRYSPTSAGVPTAA